MKKYIYFFILFLMCGLVACERKSISKQVSIVTIQKQSSENVLFYSGIIQPLKTEVITSPAEGIVVDMPFQYGERVKPNQLIFVIASEKFLTDYKAALLQYVKVKSEFNMSESQLKEAEFLHKNKLISDDSYKTTQSTFYGNQLALLQAKDTLDLFIHQLGVKEANLYQLSIADINKITGALHLKTDPENLQIMSASEGIILSPSKTEEENKKISKGDLVKQGDVLAVIGDMSGLSVRVKVSELTINQLSLSQKVKITGIAFPGEVLTGEIKQIDKQGEIENGGLSTFSVQMIVPKLSENQKKIIHVGMSAKVEIDMKDSPQLLIPIRAIHEKNGIPYVKIYDEKKKNKMDRVVKTGRTTIASVAILEGLKPGDQIVVPY